MLSRPLNDEKSRYFYYKLSAASRLNFFFNQPKSKKKLQR